MRRINFAFAAVFVLVFAAAAGGFHLLHVVQYGRIADSLRWQAERARDDDRTDEAIRYANQYLEFRPNDVGVMTDLAEWLLQRAETTRNPKHYLSALNLYDRILRLTPDDRATRRKAAELAMRLWRWPEAIDNLDILLRNEGGADLFERFAYCQLMTAKHSEAANWYKKAIDADPKRVSAYLGYASLLHSHMGRPDEALQVARRAVEVNPSSAEAQTGLAQFLRHGGQLKDATDAAGKAQSLTQDDKEQAGVLAIAAEIAQANGDYDKARELLEQGCKNYPKETRFVCSLAWLLLYEGHTAKALDVLRAGRAANPKDVDVLTLLGDLLAQDGQIAPLETTLQELTTLGAPPDRISYVQARLQMRRGRFADAAKLLDQLRTSSLRSPALYRQANHLLAQCYEQLNEANGELSAYQRILDVDPNAGTVRLEFIRALARYGRIDDALTQYLQIVSRSEVSSRAVADTTRVLIDRAGRDPKLGAALEKRFDGLKIDDANPNTVVARATLDLARHRPADILLTVDRLAKSTLQNNIALHTTLAALTEQVYGLEQALTVLTKAESLLGDRADWRAARAHMLSVRLDPAAADTLARLAQGLERFSAPDRQRVLTEVIAAFRGLGDRPAVTGHLELLVQLRPDYLPARAALFLIALRTGDDARCQAILRDIEGVEGKDGATTQLLEAQRLLWTASPGDAAILAPVTARLDAAAKLRPGDPVIEFLYGRVAELAGQADDALRRYQAAFDRGFADQPVEDVIATLPGRSGRAAITVLRDRLPLVDRLQPDRHRTIVLAALRLYDAADRETLAGKLATASAANDAVQQIWLGRLFATLDLPAQAEDAFRRASAAAPQSPEGWQALVAYRAARPDASGTDAIIAQMREQLSDIDANVVVGRAMESARRYDEAEKAYKAAIEKNPNDTRSLKLLANVALRQNKPDQARQWLEEMVKLTSPSVPEDVRWATRTLAVQLAMTPSLEAFHRALALLDRNKVNGGLFEDDQRARVLVLAAQKNQPMPGGVSARQEAIRSLEALRRAQVGRSADDLLLLAQLYRAANDEAKAREAREQLRAEFPTHFGCTLFLAREALRDGDLAACDKLLPDLRRLGPGRFEVLAIEFQYRVLSGGHDLARRLLTDYVAAAESDGARADRALRSANLVYEFLQVQPLGNRPQAAADLRAIAIAFYKPIATSDKKLFEKLGAADRARVVEAFQRLATLQAQQRPDGTNRALEIIHNQKPVFGTEAVAAAYVQVHRVGTTRPEQVEAIRKYLDEALKAAPKSTALLLSLADFYSQTAKFDLAIQTYRKVLDQERDNVVALNNLAWTLSLSKTPDKVKESLRHIQRAIDLAGPLDELLHTRAQILFESRREDDALRDMREAVTESPSAARWQEYAELLRRAGKTAEAERATAEAQRLGLSPIPTPH